MDLYEAIKQMRRISERNGTFQFAFVSFNATEGKSEGIINVPRARLTNRVSKEHNINAEMMEAYINLDTQEPRWFYQILLVEFNGQKVILQ